MSTQTAPHASERVNKVKYFFWCAFDLEDNPAVVVSIVAPKDGVVCRPGITQHAESLIQEPAEVVPLRESLLDFVCWDVLITKRVFKWIIKPKNSAHPETPRLDCSDSGSVAHVAIKPNRFVLLLSLRCTPFGVIVIHIANHQDPVTAKYTYATCVARPDKANVTIK